MKYVHIVYLILVQFVTLIELLYTMGSYEMKNTIEQKSMSLYCRIYEKKPQKIQKEILFRL